MKQHKWNKDCVLCEKGISHKHLSLEEMQSTTTKSFKYKEWQGLSDEEIKNIFVEYADLGGDIPMNACYDIYCDIERLLKEKNT